MRNIGAGLVLLALLAGCGTRMEDRALTGAGVGTLVGTAGTAIVGGSLLTGALIGAGTGAVIGAVTSPKDINLGRPWW